MRRFLLIGLLAAVRLPARAAVLKEYTGLLQVRPDGTDPWRPAGPLPRTLAPGDAVRTGYGARAAIVLDGGAALELGANTQVSLDRAAADATVVNLLFGTARVSSRALGGRPLELRAPAATARPRSEATAFRAVVAAGGRSAFEVEAGLLAVEDARGSALRLRPGERVEADLAGVREPEAVPAPSRARREDFADRARRELELDREGDSLQNLIAGETRRTEFELGRVLTDAAGLRVRAEEFVVRTGPSSFSLVALNGRRGAGISYFSWNGTFDRVLPANLEGVFDILPGRSGAAAAWTLTSFVETRSNGSDALVIRGTGGHQVDLNGNADATDDVSVLYDPASDAFRDVTGRAVYKVLFDDVSVRANGVLKRELTGTNIQSPNDAADSGPLAYTINTTFPDGVSARAVTGEFYSDGTAITTDDRSVGFGGGTLSRDAFGSATSGPGLETGFQKSALQQTLSASEFGRPVDLMVSPRLMILTGGLP